MVVGLVGYQLGDTKDMKKALLKPLPGWWIYIKRSKEDLERKQTSTGVEKR